MSHGNIRKFLILSLCGFWQFRNNTMVFSHFCIACLKWLPDVMDFSFHNSQSATVTSLIDDAVNAYIYLRSEQPAGHKKFLVDLTADVTNNLALIKKNVNVNIRKFSLKLIALPIIAFSYLEILNVQEVHSNIARSSAHEIPLSKPPKQKIPFLKVLPWWYTSSHSPVAYLQIRRGLSIPAFTKCFAWLYPKQFQIYRKAWEYQCSHREQQVKC